MRRMMLVGGAVALMLVAAACGDDSDSSSATTAGGAATTGAAAATTAAAPATTAAAAATPTEVKIGMADFSYSDVPATVTAGAVTVTATNNGQEEHQATILRLNDGVTLQQALGDFAADPNKGFADVKLFGGPNSAAPGASIATTQDLPAGNYAFVCLIPGADGIPHAAKGMLAEFQVTEATGEAAAVPSNDGEIVTNEYSFTIPADFSGKGTFAVVNQGQQNHEMAVYAIAEGKTAADVQAFFSSTTPPAGPPPITPSGGIAPAAPGTSVLSTLDLSSGNYVMMCFLPDVKTGAPHFTLGMIQPFTVS
jgi:uncharacterized cupredoxin-like copper-binding protein